MKGVYTICILLLLSVHTYAQFVPKEAREQVHEKIDAFLEWLSDAGADTSQVELELSQDESVGYTLYAAHDIQAHQDFVKIPARCLLTESYVMASPVGQVLRDSNTTVRGDIALALYLMSQYGNTTSYYAPYFALLPTIFPMPIFYPDDVRENLAQGTLKRETEAAIAYYSDLHTQLMVPLHHKYPEVFPDDSKANFFWAVTVVGTRAMFGDDGTTAMVPLIDMLNHSPHAKSRWSWAGSDGVSDFKMKYAEPIKSGDEIFLQYRPHLPNIKAVTHYGFFIDDNPDDYIELYLGEDYGEALKERGGLVFKVQAGTFPRELYEKLQVVLPDKSAAMRQIPKVLEQYLSFYSASDQFDADLLHKVTQNPLDPYLLCIINAVKQRRNERHIIQSALEKTVHYIDNLEKLSWMDEL